MAMGEDQPQVQHQQPQLRRARTHPGAAMSWFRHLTRSFETSENSFKVLSVRSVGSVKGSAGALRQTNRRQSAPIMSDSLERKSFEYHSLYRPRSPSPGSVVTMPATPPRVVASPGSLLTAMDMEAHLARLGPLAPPSPVTRRVPNIPQLTLDVSAVTLVISPGKPNPGSVTVPDSYPRAYDTPPPATAPKPVSITTHLWTPDGHNLQSQSPTLPQAEHEVTVIPEPEPEQVADDRRSLPSQRSRSTSRVSRCQTLSPADGSQGSWPASAPSLKRRPGSRRLRECAARVAAAGRTGAQDSR